MTRHLFAVLGLILFVSPLLAQNATPPVPPGQQVPKGQMPTLGRSTEPTDKVPTLDFDEYFLGKWTFEWTLPDSPLGPAGDISGISIVKKLGGIYYEVTTEGKGPSGPFKAREVWAYHRDAKIVSRTVANTPGATYFQSGPIGGDLGGIYNIHFESAPFMAGGKSVRFRSSLRLLSPLNYRVAMSLSVNDGPFTNLGNPWWRKDLSYVSK
jgi:hypothetical protein